MLKYIAIGSLGFLLTFGWGYYLGRGQAKVEVREVERITYKQGETKVVYRDRVVEKVVIRKPDGTVEERETTRDRDTTTETNRISKGKDTKPIVATEKNDYSLGIRYHLSYSDFLQGITDPSIDNTELVAGRRLLGDIWLEGGIRKDSLSLGLSIHF